MTVCDPTVVTMRAKEQTNKSNREADRTQVSKLRWGDQEVMIAQQGRLVGR